MNEIADDLANQFVDIGWKLSHEWANRPICGDGTCIRCKITGAVVEVEQDLVRRNKRLNSSKE
jgi:hypothetical protein